LFVPSFKFSFVDSFCGNCAQPHGAAGRTRVGPKISSCGGFTPLGCLVAAYLFIVPLFLLSPSFSVNSSFLLHSSGNRTAKLFPFIAVTCRNVIFFSSFPQPSSFVLVCPNFLDPAENDCYHLTRNTRGLTHALPQQHPWISRSVKSKGKQNGAMIVHLSF
jgi:hypothetical protein